jgi:hypothetical protein
VATLNQIDGTHTQNGPGTLGTIVSDGGTVDYRMAGTITSGTFRGQGNTQTAPVLILGNDPRAKTITNGSFTGGANLQDPAKTSTWTNPLTFDALSLGESVLGQRFTLART